MEAIDLYTPYKEESVTYKERLGIDFGIQLGIRIRAQGA
jgi:hypothetical protein